MTAHDFIHGVSLGVLIGASWGHVWWLLIPAALVAVVIDVSGTR